MPFPEPVEAVERQFAWMARGRKAAVLLPYYQPAYQPAANLARAQTAAGTVFAVAGLWSAEDLQTAVNNGMLGLILGYPRATKPERPTGCLTLRNRHGVELWCHLVDGETRSEAWKTLTGLSWAGDCLWEETPEEVAEKRCRYWLEKVLIEKEAKQEERRAG